MSETKRALGDFVLSTVDTSASIAGNLTLNSGNIYLNGLILLANSTGSSGQVFVSTGSTTSPVWANASPLTTKGDIYIWDTTNTRLPVGADGTYLKANSSDPTGLSWASVAGGASPLTTKGDLYTYDTSDARLAVGADGSVLKANSATATGLEWATATGSSPLTTKGDIYIYDTADDRFAVGTDGQVIKANSATSTGLEWTKVAPLTTKGDLYTYDTADARLAVGADGTYLKANSTTATGLEWATVTGSSPLTTKGDLYTFDTSNARLGVGTDYYILMANSSTATGLEWADPGQALLSADNIAHYSVLLGGNGDPGYVVYTTTHFQYNYDLGLLLLNSSDNTGTGFVTKSGQGDIVMLTPQNNQTGTPGHIWIATSDGDSSTTQLASGNLTLKTGDANTTGVPGSVVMSAGNAGTTQTGGNITISAGSGGSSSGDGGSIYIGPGPSPNANYGNLNLDLYFGMELQINSNPGTSGDVLTSAGPGIAPSWAAVSISPLTANLDVGSYSIVSSSNGNIDLVPNGTGTTNLYNAQLNSFHEVYSNVGNVTGNLDANSTIDITNGTIQEITLTGNITMNTITNMTSGESILLIVNQDGTGGWTLTSTMLFANSYSTLSNTASATDTLSITLAGTRYFASLVPGYA